MIRGLAGLIKEAQALPGYIAYSVGHNGEIEGFHKAKCCGAFVHAGVGMCWQGNGSTEVEAMREALQLAKDAIKKQAPAVTSDEG
jgi:hypothetical protein